VAEHDLLVLALLALVVGEEAAFSGFDLQDSVKGRRADQEVELLGAVRIAERPLAVLEEPLEVEGRHLGQSIEVVGRCRANARGPEGVLEVLKHDPS
jgi:hypothetical protein